MNLITAIFTFLRGLLEFFAAQRLVKSGRDAVKVEAFEEVEERWRKANEIENEPITDDAAFLLRPEERTADNLRLLQDNKTHIHGQSGASKNAATEPHEKRKSGDLQPQPKIREDLPVKFSKLPMPVQFVKPKRKVSKVFLHCSASDNPKHDNPQTIEKWHLERNFSEIGYHFYINQAGEVFQCRDVEKIPAAQKGHNTGSIAICCGGLTTFSQAQLTALYMLCKRIAEAFNNDIEFWGHCEVEPKKTCPVYPWRTILKLSKDRKMNVN
jgi:hypothetical protein